MSETQMVSPPTAFGEYNFPSRDRIELFGDDQLVNVWWRGNIFIVAPGCFRVPRAMTWADFTAQVVGPWAAADPDFDADKVTAWHLDDTPIEPSPEDTLESLGIAHKGLVSFTLA
ncbi:MAG: phenol hydroxylase subunit P4 [Actinomycetales bacterium]